jgi:16S rRNA (guanine527-N7)-methyltransferase
MTADGNAARMLRGRDSRATTIGEAEDGRVDGAGNVPAPGAAGTRERVRDDDRGPAPRRAAPDARPARVSHEEPAPLGTGPRAARSPLPTRPAELPPLGSAFEEALDAGLEELGLRGGPAGAPAARRSYEAHARLLAAWGAAINLTAIREPAAVARRHVCDALSAVPHLLDRLAEGGTLLDLGSGAGYPGLPLAGAMPLSRVALVESVAKKARFLEVAAAAVSASLAPTSGDAAPAIEVLPERAEDLAEEGRHRARWEAVTARAVGSLAEVVELGLPLLREGGWLVAWKRESQPGQLGAELRGAGRILRVIGGGRPQVLSVPGTSLAGHRLVIVRKERASPQGFPRPASVRRRGRG